MHMRHKLQLVRKEHVDDRIYVEKLQLVHKEPNEFAHLLQKCIRNDRCNISATVLILRSNKSQSSIGRALAAAPFHAV